MQEFHPTVCLKDRVLKQDKIILGSFPTHSFTVRSADGPMGETAFYYAGKTNLFWKWYGEFIDPALDRSSLTKLLESLDSKGIGITDVISSCDRKGKSASDNDLKNRVYNLEFFVSPGKGETLNILCTSKGVMNEMLLQPLFFKLHPAIHNDVVRSEELKKELFPRIALSHQHKPVLRCLKTDSGGAIELVALPSPGSPYRSLKNFGYASGDAKEFLSSYLKAAFGWFLVK